MADGNAEYLKVPYVAMCTVKTDQKGYVTRKGTR